MGKRSRQQQNSLRRLKEFQSNLLSPIGLLVWFFKKSIQTFRWNFCFDYYLIRILQEHYLEISDYYYIWLYLMFLGKDQLLPCSNIKQHIIKNNCFFIGIVENQIEMLFLAQMLIADWDFLFKGVYYKYIGTFSRVPFQPRLFL